MGWWCQLKARLGCYVLPLGYLGWHSRWFAGLVTSAVVTFLYGLWSPGCRVACSPRPQVRIGLARVFFGGAYGAHSGLARCHRRKALGRLHRRNLHLPEYPLLRKCAGQQHFHRPHNLQYPDSRQPGASFHSCPPPRIHRPGREAVATRVTAEEVTFSGSFKLAGGTGRYADLTGEGTIAGYFFCFDPQGCAANQGRYRDMQLVLMGTYYDPTGPN